MKRHKLSFLTLCSIATLLLSTFLISCNHEDYLGEINTDNLCEKIYFGILSEQKIETKASDYLVLRSEQSSDTICINAIVSDNINTSNFFKQSLVTKGSPVSNNSFYDNFHVLAYWSKNGELLDNFYINEAASFNGDVWSTNHIYYWPGSDYSFQFCALAPTNAEGLIIPNNPQNKILEYSVPSVTQSQKDIVVATTDEIVGNNNSLVSLTFKHICSTVRFVIGSQMQQGSIKSVSLKGVKNRGFFDMSTGLWILTGDTTTFSQPLNFATNGNEVNGTEITNGEGTFMMLPQLLPAGAMVEVVFTNSSGVDQILTAPIGNMEWKMGKTTTYKLSIAPDYEYEFISLPEVQDAHYVIYPITLKIDERLNEGGWTLTSNDHENVTFVEKDNLNNNGVQQLIDSGYWIDGHNGTSTLTSTTTGDVNVYLFLKENITEEDRNITLSLQPTNNDYYVPQEFSFTQYCPAWDNGIGVERIQDKDYSWGFNWDSSMKIVYSMPGGFWSAIIHILFEIFGDHTYINSSGYAMLGTWKVTVDFSKVPDLSTATSLSDGRANTIELYNFNGINEAEVIMNQLVSWGGVPDITLPTNPTDFAARACVMKNKCSVETREEQGNTIYKPVFQDEDIVWYLPAQEEAQNMNDNLNGDYWTSTAITNPGTTAYKYTSEGATIPEERNSVIHVRAVRKK